MTRPDPWSRNDLTNRTTGTISKGARLVMQVEVPIHPRVVVHRNRGGFLLGVTWVHVKTWPQRLTYFYLGWWVLTIRTGASP